MKNAIFLLVAVCVTFGAEATKKQHRKKQTTKKIVVRKATIPAVKYTNKSTTMRLCNAIYPQPAWFLEVPKMFDFPTGFARPASFRLVSTIDTTFHSFLKSIPYQGSKESITLPVLINNVIECKEFNISRTMTMDSALQAKYPQLMSFKGFTASNSLNTARIDCDETSVRIMVTYDTKVYYINSLLYNGMQYYVCYAKDDGNFVKEKFER